MSLAVLSGCVKEENFEDLVPGQQAKDGDMIQVKFSMNVPEMASLQTRSLGTEASIYSLYVVVFDANSYLKEFAKAELDNNPQPSPDSELENFKVNLHKADAVSGSKYTVHFIANFSEDEMGNLAFGNENMLIGSMVVDTTLRDSNGNPYPEDVYWQRIQVDSIAPQTFTKFCESLDPQGIPLVRNFCEIQVTADSSFPLADYYVVNVPEMGTVAPYDGKNRSFADYISAWSAESPATPTSYPAYNYLLLESKYSGRIPNNTGYFHAYDDPNPNGWEGVAQESGIAVTFDSDNSKYIAPPFFMYEHPGGMNVGDYSTCLILLKVSSEETNGVTVLDSAYYKVDITYKDVETQQPEYYNLLRDFKYTVNINSCQSDGYSSIAEALAHPADNNLSSSVMVSHLTNISNGKERLFVTFTDTTITSTDPIKLRYKYLQNISDTSPSNDDVLVRLNTNQDEFISSIQTASTDDADGWRTVTITPDTTQSPTSTMLTQSIIIYTNPANISTDVPGINRVARIHYVSPFDMLVNCNATVVDSTKKVNVTIALPSNLQPSIFPLEFLVESEHNNLYPDASTEYMPVRGGSSIIPSKSGSLNYGFVKAITYDDYVSITTGSDGRKDVVCHMLSNEAVIGESDNVYVYNKYFVLRHGSYVAP